MTVKEQKLTLAYRILGAERKHKGKNTKQKVMNKMPPNKAF